MSDNFALGNTAQRVNTIRQLEVKILNVLNAGGVGGGGSGNPAPGVVNPNGNVTANAGATYWNSANGTFWEKQSGSGNTGWVQLI